MNGVRRAVRRGVVSSARSIADRGIRENTRQAAAETGKVVTTSVVKTTVDEVSEEAKAVADKGVVYASERAGEVASDTYVRVATDQMNRNAAALSGKAKEDYIRQQRRAIASRATQINRGMNNSANFVGRVVTNAAVNTATGNVKSKADNVIKKIGSVSEKS